MNNQATPASASDGLTLLELAIVIAMITMLVIVILPAYQQVRDSAYISKMVRDLMAYARSCAAINGSELGDGQPSPPSAAPERGGIEILSGCTPRSKGAMLQATWGPARAEGIPCLDSRSTLLSRKATIVISPGNEMHCLFEP